MKIHAKVKSALNKAFELKYEKKYKEAAEIYLQIIAIEIEENDDPIFIGIHYISLGNALKNSGLDEDALNSYKIATEILDGQKGDAILQRSYALQNMTDILLRNNDPHAKITSTEALDILRAYPYTTTTDLANAVIRHFLVHMFIDNYLKESDFVAVWKTVKDALFEKIDRFYTFNFIINYLSYNKNTNHENYKTIRLEVEKWATPDVFSEAVALVEDGQEKYQGVWSKNVLKKAIMGIVDPDDF